MAKRSAPSGVATRSVPGAAGDIDVHLRLGGDPCREMVVWWSTVAEVKAPQILLGAPHTGYNRVVPASTVTYRDARSGETRYLHYTTLTRLCPGARYIYLAAHNGVATVAGEFRTLRAPAGRPQAAPDAAAEPVG